MTVIVKKYPGDPFYLNQITGVPLTMALLSPENVQLHPPVMCKDYLNDPFWSEITKQDVDDVYGFSWKTGTFNPKRRVQRIHLKFRTGALAEASMTNILALLNMVEKQMGFPRSRAATTTVKNSRVLLVSRKWTEQPIRISMYTLMIRIGNMYNPGESLQDFITRANEEPDGLLHPDDRYMVQEAKNRMLEIFNTKTFPPQTFEWFVKPYNVHNYSGICNYQHGQDYGNKP